MLLRYDDFDVPDTMNVHGVYDTSATMLTYYSREEYQQSLQEQAGVSGSIFGFYAGVKKAWGSSFLSGSQKYMAVYSIDIDRWLNIIFNLSPCVHCIKLVQSFYQIFFWVLAFSYQRHFCI